MYVSNVWIQKVQMQREHINLQFAIKCTKHKTNQKIYPMNPSADTHMLSKQEQEQEHMFTKIKQSHK